MTTELPLAGVILTAGKSYRMGRPKALLPWKNSTFLESIITTLHDAEIQPIVVVVGHHAREIEGQADLAHAEVVMNEQYADGQLSSIHAALNHLDTQLLSGVLMCLVDHPLFSAELVRQMIDTFRNTGSPLVIPSHKKRRGHPVIFSAELFPELLASPIEKGARPVVKAHTDDIHYVDTDEEGILWDINTPAKYEEALKHFD
jgi:molybdenum cofactor cytidylyltransferase